MSQERTQEFQGHPDHLCAEAKTRGSEKLGARACLETSRAWQLRGNECGHTLASKMALPVRRMEEWRGGQEAANWREALSSFPGLTWG